MKITLTLFPLKYHQFSTDKNSLRNFKLFEKSEESSIDYNKTLKKLLHRH